MNSPGSARRSCVWRQMCASRSLQHGFRAGRGFEIAQGRLGPGRIHHCMRSIGQALSAHWRSWRKSGSKAALPSARNSRTKAASVRLTSPVPVFARSSRARLLTLKAADAMDKYGNKVARDLIAAIKVIAPQHGLQTVTDRCDPGAWGHGRQRRYAWIAGFFTLNRMLRLADGPDEVHRDQVGRHGDRQVQLSCPERGPRSAHGLRTASVLRAHA